MNQKRWTTYVLSPNHRTVFPAEIIYFDCETNFNPNITDQVHPFRLGVLIRQRYRGGQPTGRPQCVEFDSPDEFWDYLDTVQRPKRRIWVMAHNLDFDFAAVDGFRNLAERHYEVPFWAFAPRAFILRAQRNKCALQFVDSMNFLTTSIAALGKGAGLEKLPMPDPQRDRKPWIEYCTRDVEILQASFERYMAFVAEHDLGHLALTGPGQAMAAFRHRFMGERLVLHSRQRLAGIERSMYHGGRTEAFYIGDVPESPIWYLDVNSMYPHVMKTGSYPCEFVGEVHDPSKSDLTTGFKRFEVGADVTLEIPEPAVPYVSDRLLFPVGRFRTVLPGPEFRYCYERGWVKRTHIMYVYRRGHPFTSYVEYFYDHRKRFEAGGDDPQAWLCKLMLNSLYGKFGQRNPDYEIMANAEGWEDGVYYTVSSATMRREIRVVIGDKVWIRAGDHPSQFTFYPMAAWVTSYARVLLWDLIKEAGREHTYYVDTDSVFVDRVGFDRVSGRIAPGALGALDIKQTGQALEIRGAKDYTLDSVDRIKGVPRSAQRLPDGSYQFWTFDRVRTRLRHGAPDEIVQRTVTKRLRREYEKGVVGDDGWVSPFELV